MWHWEMHQLYVWEELECKNLGLGKQLQNCSQGVFLGHLESLTLGVCRDKTSFKVTTSKDKKYTGSVTTPLFGSNVVDLETQESKKFHLIIVFGEDVERFCYNNSLLAI